MGLQTAGLCYAQSLNNVRRTLSVTPLRNLPVNKILAEFRLSQRILHLCTQKSVCATNFGPYGERSVSGSGNRLLDYEARDPVPDSEPRL